MKKISTLLLCIVLAAALALAATTVGCKGSGTDKPNENQGDNDMNNDKIIATIEMENGAPNIATMALAQIIMSMPVTVHATPSASPMPGNI